MNVALVYMNNEANVGRGAGYIAGSVLAHGHELTFSIHITYLSKLYAAGLLRADSMF